MKIAAIAFTSVAYLASLIPAADAVVSYQDQAIAAHNSARAQYGAGPLIWDSSKLPSIGLFIHQCSFNHTKGPYGENLFKTTNLNLGIYDAVWAWMTEVSNYDYARPGPSSPGNFTQVVWKNSTRVACAQVPCPAGSLVPEASLFTVCRYTLPGNIAGQYAQNVGQHV
ncbi:MAG: CAP domain-containing protein [Linnemannia elongata]|nr:MAG: CAP domain-containing protein [Linnemannia elongata]